MLANNGFNLLENFKVFFKIVLKVLDVRGCSATYLQPSVFICPF